MSLGLAIYLDRVCVASQHMDYEFRVEPGRGGRIVRQPTGRPGMLRIDTTTGEVELIRDCPDDQDNSIAARAMVALKKRWLEGAMPPTTSWEA